MIQKGNKIGLENDERDTILSKIKKSIADRDENQLLEHLASPNPLTRHAPKVTKARGDIYLAELESYEELTSELLSDNIGTISNIATINHHLDNGDCDDCIEALNDLEIDSVDNSNKVVYYEALQEANFGQEGGYLDFQRIQQIVHRVNAQQDYYQEQLLAVQKVNEAVIDSNEELVFASLNNKILNLPELDPQVRFFTGTIETKFFPLLNDILSMLLVTSHCCNIIWKSMKSCGCKQFKKVLIAVISNLK